ncbi:MAG: 4-hydroxythreonine-4-phosphate dehydrogenase PdxA, partial [Planctomycetia bacterium]
MGKPAIALTLGDPAGIGPEIALAALADPRVRSAMELLVVGPERHRPHGFAREHWIVSEDPGEFVMGRAQVQCGRAALSALRLGHELALSGRVQALVTGPVSKEALHLAGEKVEGQTELLGRWCGVTRFEMLAIAGSLRVMLLTRHMPLRVALD